MASSRERSLERQLETAQSALRVIYTWATYANGIMLYPSHVAAQCQRGLAGDTRETALLEDHEERNPHA